MSPCGVTQPLVSSFFDLKNECISGGVKQSSMTQYFGVDAPDTVAIPRLIVMLGGSLLLIAASQLSCLQN
jgi:hypothetical protein